MLKALRITAFLTFALALTLPLAAAAQQLSRKVPRIGWLANHAPAAFKPYERFREGLRELGYVEGQNVEIELVSAQGQLDRLPELAKELVRRNVDVLMTGGEQGLMAAKQATTTVPIVSIVCDMREKVIEKLARPGGKATGLTCISSDLSRKRLELLGEAVPKLSRVAVLCNPGEPQKVVESREMQQAARQLNLALSVYEVHSASDIEAAWFARTYRGSSSWLTCS